MFSIGLYPLMYDDLAIGFIDFDNEKEIIECTTNLMEPADYLRQWLMTLNAMVIGHSSSGIIIESVSLNDKYIMAWPFYNIKDKVIFRQQIFEMPKPITNKYIDLTAPNYESTECSEWEVRYSDIKEFICSLNRPSNF